MRFHALLFWCSFAATAVVASASSSSSSSSTSSSSGCGKDSSYKTGDLHSEWIMSDDHNRTYLINLPTAYDGKTAAPLILSFHGNGLDADDQAHTDMFYNETWNPNSVVVWPQGIDGWQGAPYHNSSINDLNFTSTLLASLTSTLCIDPTRVYCTGKSIGGGFCNILACDSSLSSSFAAIAPVSGAFYTTPSNASFESECSPSHRIPILEFHGSDDPIIPYTGGDVHDINLRSIPDWANAWAELDGCSAGSSPSDISHMNDSKVLWASYNCTNSSSSSSSSSSGDGETVQVQHYEIDGLGHTWPSKGWNLENQGDGSYLDASPLIIEFFASWKLDDEGASSSSASGTTSTKTATATGKTTATATATSKSSKGAAATKMAKATGFPGLVGAIAVGVLVL